MFVKDIILKACDFIENDELAQAIEQDSALDEEKQNALDKLLKCFNLVRNEIVCEYMPIVNMERVICHDGKINFNQFKKKVVDIISVKDNFGNNVKFKIFDDFMLVEGGDVLVCYNSSTDELDLDGEFFSTISDRVYAYGVVREYYFIQTLYEDAKVWDERFKSSLQIFERKKGDTVLPRRRWI